MILLGFKVFATQLDFFAKNVALWLNIFIISLLLKFLSVMKVLLVNNFQILELKEYFFCNFL